MKRERYKGYVLVAKADKVRGQRIWTARVFIERFIAGGWQDLPIPGLEGQQFDGEVNTQSAALSHGRHYVDGILPQGQQSVGIGEPHVSRHSAPASPFVGQHADPKALSLAPAHSSCRDFEPTFCHLKGHHFA